MSKKKKVVKTDAELSLEAFTESLAGKSAEELTAIAIEQFTNNQENEALVKEQNAMIKNAGKELAKAKTVVTFKGKSYQVNAKSFSYKKIIVIASELGENVEVLQALIEGNSGLLTEI